MRLPGQLPLEQVQVVAQALVAELVRPRVLVQAAVLELAQMQAQRLVQVQVPELELVLGLQLEPELPVVLARELQLERELPVVLARELVLARAAAPEPRQVRELRVSRQQEQQQHRLLAAAQELPPYLPALPMKVPY